MKIAVMCVAVIGVVFFIEEWAAVFGHCPEYYHIVIQWPWPPIGTAVSIVAVLVSIASQINDEAETERLNKELEVARKKETGT